MYQLLIILAFGSSLASFGIGTWAKDLKPVKPFTPDFILLKTGIFSKTGHLKELFSAEEIKGFCRLQPKIEGWVTHRLSKGETWDEGAGKKLGKALQKQLGGTCVEAIELNAEPFSEVPDWLLNFLKALRSEVGPLKVRFAGHALSEKPLLGPTWNAAQTEKLLTALDGVDFMMYDTGFTTSESYSELLVKAFIQLESWSERFKEKKFILGLPAYYDKTKLHKIEVENLKTVLKALSNYTPKNKASWCEFKIQFALYAGWTLKEEDKAISQLIRAWREAICKKN